MIPLHSTCSMYAPLNSFGFIPIDVPVTSEVSQRIYMTFKSARTILTSIKEKIVQKEFDIPKLESFDKSTLETMNSCLDQLLDSTLQNLFKNADDVISTMRNILYQNSLNSTLNSPDNPVLHPSIEKSATTLLSSAFSLIRTESMLAYEAAQNIPRKRDSIPKATIDISQHQSFSSPEKTPEEPLRSNSTTNLSTCHTKSFSSTFDTNDTSIMRTTSLPDHDLVVCRICDQSVPASLFEQHTNSCIQAYQSEDRLVKLDHEILDIKSSLESQYLDCEWPGDFQLMFEEIIPTLQFCLIVQKVYDADPHMIDTADDLLNLLNSLAHVLKRVHFGSKEKKCMALAREKRRRSIALTNAASILRATTISGSHKTTFDSNISISDFSIFKRISSGAYARVFLGKKKTTGDIYAIKVLPRAEMHQKNQVQRVLTERDILLKYSNPYIVNFYYSIIGKRNLYLVMEYLPGGDLYSLLDHLGSLDEESAKIYTYQIVKVLEFLRSCGIIHRDLKPDNILISSTGVLKLTDFGLSHVGSFDRQAMSQQSMIQSESIVGTPDYTAPEIILNKMHTFTADYWSLGIILYEFLMGYPPFHGETETETHTNIIRGFIDWNELKENEFNDSVIDLLQKLLVSDPEKRLGSKDIKEILNHPWFDGIDENHLQPPFIPSISEDTDTDYFTERNQLRVKDDSDILEDMGESFSEMSKEIEPFQAISIEQLKEKNAVLVEHIKSRDSSFSSLASSDYEEDKLFDSVSSLDCDNHSTQCTPSPLVVNALKPTEFDDESIVNISHSLSDKAITSNSFEFDPSSFNSINSDSFPKENEDSPPTNAKETQHLAFNLPQSPVPPTIVQPKKIHRKSQIKSFTPAVRNSPISLKVNPIPQKA